MPMTTNASTYIVDPSISRLKGEVGNLTDALNYILGNQSIARNDSTLLGYAANSFSYLSNISTYVNNIWCSIPLRIQTLPQVNSGAQSAGIVLQDAHRFTPNLQLLMIMGTNTTWDGTIAYVSILGTDSYHLTLSFAGSSKDAYTWNTAYPGVLFMINPGGGIIREKIKEEVKESNKKFFEVESSK